MPDNSPLAPLSFETLKAKQRLLRDGFPPELGLRVHRAISWLHRAEMAQDDLDAAFIFYWIAFNAAYAQDGGWQDLPDEKSRANDFLGKLIKADTQKLIHTAVWERFSGPIRLLLDSRYVFQPFWNFHNQVPGYENWENSFTNGKKRATTALANQDTLTVLTIVFNRLYTLRNQLMHGGATWNSSVNRQQTGDGVRILGFLIPVMIDLMMDHPEKNWGTPYYPVAK